MDYLFEHYSKEKEVLITFAKLPTPEQLESLGTIHSQNGVQVSFLIPRSGVSHFIKIVLHDYVIDDLSIRELEATDIIADIFSSSIPLS